MRTLLLGLLVLASCGRSGAAGPAPAEFVYDVDADAALALGWGCSGDPVEAARNGLRERLRRRRPELGVDVRVDERGRVVVEPNVPLGEEQHRSLDRLITSTGKLAFRPVVDPLDLAAEGGDLEAEEERLSRWLEGTGSGVACFASVPREEGGPAPSLSWHALRPAARAKPGPHVVPLLREPSFDAFDLERVFYAEDRLGYPAVGFEMHDAAAEAFEAFTERFVDRQLAILVAGEVVSAPVIGTPLPGAGVVQGQFTEEEVRELITSLRSSDEGGVFRLVSPGR